MAETEIHYPEDGNWTEEDIEEFVKSANKEDYDIETGGKPDDQPPVHPGAVMVGLVLFCVLVYSLYISNFEFATVNASLLVVLALGSKAIN